MPGIKTKDMNLREYLSTMSFQPVHAEKIEKLFDLENKLAFLSQKKYDGPEVDLGISVGLKYASEELKKILGTACKE